MRVLEISKAFRVLSETLVGPQSPRVLVPLTPEQLSQFEEIPICDSESEIQRNPLVFDDSGIPIIESKVRKIMKEKQINQTELAKKLGDSPAAVSKLLNEPEKSKVVTLAKVARALDVSLAALFSEEKKDVFVT